MTKSSSPAYKKKAVYLPLIIVTAIAVLAWTSLVSILLYRHFHPAYQTQQQHSRLTVPNFNHIFLIMEENEGNGDLIGNPQLSFINSLVERNSYARNYTAMGHPSLPNYLWLTGGSNGGITGNCAPLADQGCIVNARNMADTIEASGRNWKAYLESMPSNCAMTGTDLYSTLINPFIYYSDIANNPDRCNSHDVPFSEFSNDLSQNNLPDFSFITPNMCDNMHNYKECPVSIADTWLAGTVTKILDSPAYRMSNSLIIITWDEGGAKSLNNKVPLILIGQNVKEHYISDMPYNHVSVLKTIEEAWDLPPLNKNDKSANSLDEFFN